MLDRYHIGEHTRQSPEAEVPLIEQIRIDDRLGGAGNVAYNLKSLELNPILISVIGADKEGEIIEQLCKDKFDTFHLLTLSDRPSTLKSRIVNQEFNQFLRLDREITLDLSLPNQQTIKLWITEALKTHSISALVIQDYNKGLLTFEVISFLQKLCLEYNIPLIVDPKKNHFILLSNCNVFKPNLKELSQAVGYKVLPQKEDILLAINELDLNKAQYIVVTLAENGIFYFDKESGEYGVVKGQKIDSPDVSGAGDTVLSTLVRTMVDGQSIQQMAETANMAGAIVCRKKGIEVVHLNELNP